jgi:hypothetical protein
MPATDYHEPVTTPIPPTQAVRTRKVCAKELCDEVANLLTEASVESVHPEQSQRLASLGRACEVLTNALTTLGRTAR